MQPQACAHGVKYSLYLCHTKHSVWLGYQPANRGHAGARQEELAQAAAEGAAWVDFQRMAAWWLGEHANVATDEYAGTSGVSSVDAEDAGLIKPGSGRVVINTEDKQLSAGEVCAARHAKTSARKGLFQH